MARVFSGIQPTGDLHLGNYLGAVVNWVRDLDRDESIFCIVDLHAITIPQDPAELKARSRNLAALLMACGLDPERCILFVQSHVPQHAQLAWLMQSVVSYGELGRMTQFKEKSGKHKENAGLGLYSYPVLQAADILLYHATHVPVGEDQKQHLELARDIAGTARTLRGSAVTLRDRLLGILAWAEVPGERSARLGLVKVIIDRLDALLADTANIDRIQRLAGLSQETGYKSLQRLVRNLGDETAALADIEGARLAYEHIGRRGSAEDKTAVVDRLHNILTDGLDTGSLRELVTAWAAEAARRFKALLDDDIGHRPPVQPPVQPPVPPPNARNFVCKDLPRAQATAAITKALEQALADIPGARFTISVIVEPAT